jgi:hypothetical protein
MLTRLFQRSLRRLFSPGANKLFPRRTWEIVRRLSPRQGLRLPRRLAKRVLGQRAKAWPPLPRGQQLPSQSPRRLVRWLRPSRSTLFWSARLRRWLGHSPLARRRRRSRTSSEPSRQTPSHFSGKPSKKLSAGDVGNTFYRRYSGPFRIRENSLTGALRRWRRLLAGANALPGSPER